MLILPGFTRRRVGRRKICNAFFIILFLVSTTSLYFLFDRVILSSDNVVNDDVMVVIRDTLDQKEYIDKKGIHVIVGQYVGQTAIDWDGVSGNISQDVLNQNNYNPIPKAGEFGMAVYVPSFEKDRMKILYHVNKFNIMASDRISVNRSLPDPRKESCKKKIYNVSHLPDASVIIVFHNEAWSTLLRTLHSVLNRTPAKILKEVILVDDASQRTFLKDPLDEYLAQVNNNSRVPVHILRSHNRTGLIRARLLGADVSIGKTLVFLDAHCEVTIGWLEPLLERVFLDSKTVVAPVIDVIHDETFAYAKSFELHWGGFNWNMHFRWFPIGSSEIRRRSLLKNKDTDPFISPIIAGGLFAMDRQFFYDIGSYDKEMDIWGGENLEMSLRVWTCGGRMEISPCSHVGHLFRKSSPYTFIKSKHPSESSVAAVLYGNLARVAEVWMDDYKDFFYTMNPLSHVDVDQESLEPRKKLRRDLKCKSFEWFLDNVWPEHFFPRSDRFFGQIQSEKTHECVQRPSGRGASAGVGPVGKLDLERCTIEAYSPQSFIYTKKGFIMSDDSVCLDVVKPYGEDSLPVAGSTVLLLGCSEMSRQKWRYDPVTKRIEHVSSDLCLSIDSSSFKHVILDSCLNDDSGDKRQKWNLVPLQWNKKQQDKDS